MGRGGFTIRGDTGNDHEAEGQEDCNRREMTVPIVYANALGWRPLTAMIARTAAALYPDLRFRSVPYGVPRLLRPLLKDIYGLSFPRRLSLISSERITTGMFGRRLVGPDLPQKLILLAGSTVGLVRHLSPAGTALLVTDMTNALAARLYGARFSRYDIDLERRSLKRCAKVFAMSSVCADSLREDYGLDASRVELFLPPTIIPPARTVRNSTGLPTIGFVGTDFGRKGGFDLLEVYRESLAGRANLIIVSADAPSNVSLPGVKFLGRLPHDVIINEILPSLDVFCLPTRRDCSPLAITEAMAAGVPIVSTALFGIRDLVSDGVTGLLVQPGDKQGLRMAIERMIGDVAFRLRCGEAARHFAEETLAVEIAVPRLVEAIF
jgi:glycosyltransferase involved in cell wall biosynthesis